MLANQEPRRILTATHSLQFHRPQYQDGDCYGDVTQTGAVADGMG